MGISNTTRLVCDFEKDGKPCGRTFLLPDPPEEPTPGAENTISMTIGATGQKLFFCSMLHAVAYGVDYIKSTPKEKSQPPAAERRNAPDDFNLKD